MPEGPPEAGTVSPRCFCNDCQQETNHFELSRHDRRRNEGDAFLPRLVDEAWSILQCRGCDAITIWREESSTDFKTPRIVHYPSRERRRLPVWAPQLPTALQELVAEIYKALHAKCNCLATMGARTLLDGLFLELVGDVGGFDQKLITLAKMGHITEQQQTTISVALEAGNAAAHRGFQPTEEQLYDALDIVEHILRDQYVIPPSSQRLAGGVPPRHQGGISNGA